MVVFSGCCASTQRCKTYKIINQINHTYIQYSSDVTSSSQAVSGYAGITSGHYSDQCHDNCDKLS